MRQHAILFSLVQSCKHLQINPFVYLRDDIRRVSNHPARHVLELTPASGSACGGFRRASQLNRALPIRKARRLPSPPISSSDGARPPATFCFIHGLMGDMRLFTRLRRCQLR